jgi:peptidyl-prolyl cis-trans isomerase D
MLNNIRKFSKTIFAKIILVIMIVPFVLWGMGGVFSSGNTNNIVKINNENITTADFVDYINNSKIDQNIIKDNIENNVLEELLSRLVSEKLIKMEIKNLDIHISENSLVNRIKRNTNFIGEDGKFSRTKYEKFLLSQNLTAPGYEEKLKHNELRKKLFSYVSGGIKSPLFLINSLYEEQTNQLDISFVSLDNEYKKKENFTESEINKFINDNSEKLKEEYLNFSYIKITPKDLTGSEDYNELFFKKIDTLENEISNGKTLNEIANDFKVKIINKNNFRIVVESNDIEKLIYKNRNENKIQLIDKNDFYLLYEIKKIEKILPNISDKIFKNRILKAIFEKNKFEFNQNLIKKITNKEINKANFNKFSDGKIEKIKINSITDENKFAKDSLKLLYSRPINSFTLIADKNNKIYLATIDKVYTNKLINDSKDFINYNNQTNIMMRNYLYSSYDLFLSAKYKVDVNQSALERVKNFFR